MPGLLPNHPSLVHVTISISLPKTTKVTRISIQIASESHFVYGWNSEHC